MSELSRKPIPEQFDIWKRRIQLAKERHRTKVVNEFEKTLKLYRGTDARNPNTNEEYTQVAQILHSVEETILPHLIFKNPVFVAKVQDFKAGWEKREGHVAQMVNYEYRDINAGGHGIELENELATIDARLAGYGVTETSWEVEGDIIPAESPNLLDQTASLLTGSRPDVQQIPVITKELGQRTVRVNPLKFFLDFRAEHITKCKFFIRVMDVDRDFLRKPRYNQEIVDKAEPTVSLVPRFANDRQVSSEDKDKLLEKPDFKGFRIYEIEDLEDRVIHTVMDGANEFIEFGSPHPLAEGSKYSLLWFLEEPNEAYPMSPTRFYMQRANEFSWIYSSISKQIDKFLPKLLVDVNAIDGPEKEKLKNGNLGTIVCTNRSPAASAMELNPKVSPDLFTYLALTKELLNMESGVSDYETASPERRKATEAAIIQKGVRTRRQKSQKRVKDFLTNQAHKIWEIVARSAPIDHFARILGMEAALEWWQDPETGKAVWTDENLRADYWFTYDMDSILPVDTVLQKQQNIESLSTVLNPNLNLMLQQEGIKLKVSPVFAKFAQENLGIKDLTTIMESLQILSPEKEFEIMAMTGEPVPIPPDEANNPQKLLEHYQAHTQQLQSPLIEFMHPRVKGALMAHYQQYAPIVMAVQQRMQQQATQPSSDVQPKAPEEPRDQSQPQETEERASVREEASMTS